MAKKLLGKEVAAAIDKVTNEMMNICKRKPRLGIIRVGDDPGAISYERSIIKKCAALDIDYYEADIKPLDIVDSVADLDVIKTIDDLNNNPLITGILLCRPLPPGFRQEVIESAIDLAKDVDGANAGNLSQWKTCTAEACIKMLEYYEIPIAGKHAVIVGRSDVVGKPVANMLLDRDATITICHSKTSDLKAITREADILISATGKPGLITADFVRPGQTVIDVGMNIGADDKLCGDVDYATVEPIVDAITPVPGGVGAVTTSCLLQNVVDATIEYEE